MLINIILTIVLGIVIVAALVVGLCARVKDHDNYDVAYILGVAVLSLLLFAANVAEVTARLRAEITERGTAFVNPDGKAQRYVTEIKFEGVTYTVTPKEVTGE